MSRTSRTRLIRVLCLAIIGSLAGVVMSAQSAFALCTNRPPEYPGCTSAQLVPGSIALAKREFTGHQKYYRHHQWGNHEEGVVWHGISAKTNHILSVKYATFVHKFRKHNHGHYPHYRTWKGLKHATIGGCIRLRKRYAPDKSCHYTAPGTYQITGIMSNGQEDPNWHFVSKCNGVVIGAAASGATVGAIATVAGGEETGGLLIAGGAATTGFAAEVGCQVTSLYNWMFPGSNKVANASWGYN